MGVIKKTALAFTLLISLLLFSVSSYADFKSDYESSLTGKKILNAKQIQNLNNYHFVFISGFTGELIQKRYFSENVASLKNLGVENVSTIIPSSLRAAEDNIEVLNEKVRALYKSGEGRPIVLIGHSKGGLESVATILNHPNLVTDGIVHKVVAVQSPLRRVVLGDQFNSTLKWMTPIFPSDGAESLTTGEIDRIIRQKINSLDAGTKQRLSNSVGYVISEKSPSEMAKAISRMGAFLQTQYNLPSDGLVDLYGQWINGFGKVLGKVNADHVEFVVPYSKNLNTGSDSKASAFALSLAKAVTEKDEAPVVVKNYLRPPTQVAPPKKFIRICFSLYKIIGAR